METKEAIKIIRSLSDGINPLTGKTFPQDSIYQNLDIIRALYKAVDAMKMYGNMEKRSGLPFKAGSSWSDSEDKELVANFDSGKSITQLAKEHQRSVGAIRSRLVKLGRIKEKE